MYYMTTCNAYVLPGTQLLIQTVLGMPGLMYVLSDALS
jgi:hypothetical protein